MKTIDKMLFKSKSNYLTGNTITLADLLIYNEFSLFLALHNMEWEDPEIDNLKSI